MNKTTKKNGKNGLPFGRKHHPHEIRRIAEYYSSETRDTRTKTFCMHEGDAASITAAIDSLHFNSSLIKTQKIDDEERLLFSDVIGQQRKLLWQMLAVKK